MARIIKGLGKKIIEYIRGEIPEIEGMLLITIEKAENGGKDILFTPQGRIELDACNVAIASINNFISLYSQNVRGRTTFINIGKDGELHVTQNQNRNQT